jgi:hypothetical protein
VSFVSLRMPKLRLPKLLRRPGGPPVVEALEAAATNLRNASGAYVAELTLNLEALEAAIGDLPQAYDAARLDQIYGLASAPIGVASVCGLETYDAALMSLCDLLDHLKTQALWDHEAIAVHVRALHLLLGGQVKTGSVGAEAVLDGLRQVSQRYAA